MNIPYKLHHSGLEYRFDDRKTLTDFVDSMFTYCINRRELYECLMTDTLDHVLQFASDLASQNESVAMLRSLQVISELYGKTYDPDQEIFQVVKDNNNILSNLN